MGTYEQRSDSIAVHPGAQSYHSQEGATISFDNGMVTAISGDQKQQLSAYELEPQLITSLSEGPNRVKRRLVTYDELPPDLVKAVTSIEDKRFFSHSGVDYISLLGWIYHDLIGDRRYRGGASTLTMQLSRNFFDLTRARSFRRKIIETAITFQLEHRYTKQQIFQMYANEIPLGQQGSFGIYGIGEAAQAYFGKDVRQLDLAECALLAGMIQQPSALNPYHHAKRAIARRNVVLGRHGGNRRHHRSAGHAAQKRATAPRAELLRRRPRPIFHRHRARPDRPQLWRAAIQLAGPAGLQLARSRPAGSCEPGRRHRHGKCGQAGGSAARKRVKHPETVATPQVALVALNPHTGQVLALVGGRSYGASQLNHAIAHRPTGSIFKPFVFAAAFNTCARRNAVDDPGYDSRRRCHQRSQCGQRNRRRSRSAGRRDSAGH